MRYYLKTSDQRYVESYDQLAEMKLARVQFALKLARSWGFDEIGLNDFSNHVAFFKLASEDDRRLRFGPPIEGFRACRENPKEHYNDRLHFRYYFHGNNKVGTQLRKKLEEGMPPVPDELNKHQFRNTVDTAFCIRHGLPTEHFAGNKILFPVVYLLRDDILVMSLPVTDEEVVIPDNCEEITERAWGAEIDKHNAEIKEPSHDNQ